MQLLRLASRKTGLMILMAGLCLAFSLSLAASPTVDLPACDQLEPATSTVHTLGIVQPGAAENVLEYAARLPVDETGASTDAVRVCSEQWSRVLPRWAPWGSPLERGQGWGFWLLGLLLSLVLAYWLTPRAWWKRPTVLGLGSLAVGTWVLGALGLALFHVAGGQSLLYDTVVSMADAGEAPRWADVTGARDLDRLLREAGWNTIASPAGLGSEEAVPQENHQQSAMTDSATVTQPDDATVAGQYRVRNPLNLRTGPSTSEPLLRLLPVRSSLQADGQRQGDWWHVRTQQGEEGWVSSLWLDRVQATKPALDEG